MKIVVLDGYTENPGDLSWDGLKKFGELAIYDRTPAELVAERIGDCEIVFTNKTPVTDETIRKCTNIKYIGVLATGYNIVDIMAAKEFGITVSNIPEYGTNAVAQMTIALLLEICHHVGEHSRAIKEGRWTICNDWCFWDYPLIELSGKTIGIIGYGRIGQAVGRIAGALGMEVIAFDSVKKDVDGARLVELSELFAVSDVISLHCPLFSETERIINKDSIALMKDGVIIINTSRGGLIDEGDLCAALESKKVFAAGLDVVSKEPICEDNPLLMASGSIITPHISWAPYESRKRLMDYAVDNLKAYLGGTPINIVGR